MLRRCCCRTVVYGSLRPKDKLSLIRKSGINTLVFGNTSDDDDEDDDDNGNDFDLEVALLRAQRESIEMLANHPFP